MREGWQDEESGREAARVAGVEQFGVASAVNFAPCQVSRKWLRRRIGSDACSASPTAERDIMQAAL